MRNPFAAEATKLLGTENIVEFHSDGAYLQTFCLVRTGDLSDTEKVIVGLDLQTKSVNNPEAK